MGYPSPASTTTDSRKASYSRTRTTIGIYLPTVWTRRQGDYDVPESPRKRADCPDENYADSVEQGDLGRDGSERLSKEALSELLAVQFER